MHCFEVKKIKSKE